MPIKFELNSDKMIISKQKELIAGTFIALVSYWLLNAIFPDTPTIIYLILMLGFPQLLVNYIYNDKFFYITPSVIHNNDNEFEIMYQNNSSKKINSGAIVTLKKTKNILYWWGFDGIKIMFNDNTEIFIHAKDEHYAEIVKILQEKTGKTI